MVLVFDNIKITNQDTIDPNSVVTMGYLQSSGLGVTGAQGPQGNSGNNGTAGAQGNTGAQGPQGNSGNNGTAGAQGNTGAQGPQGNSGNNGTAGAQGNTGAQGPQGNSGNNGSAGAQGNTGAQGPQGNSGNNGSAGAQGNTGAQGPQGVGLSGISINNGNVGIGITATSAKLEVNGTGKFNGNIAIGANVDSNYGLFINGSNLAVPLVLKNNTVNPSWNNGSRIIFDVNGIGHGSIGLPSSGNLGGAKNDLIFETGSTPLNYYFNGNLQTPGVERMRITNSGRVGIGNSAPKGTLDLENNLEHEKKIVLGGGSSSNIGHTYQNYYLGVGTNSSQSDWDKIKYNADNHVFYSLGNELMRIQENGNVGIGTSNANSRLDVSGTLNVSGNSTFTSVNISGLGVTGTSTFTNTTESTSTSNGSIVVSGGVGIAKNLNVGQQITTSGLGVTGTSTFTNTTESTSTSNGSIVVSGGVGIAKNLNVAGYLGTDDALQLQNSIIPTELLANDHLNMINSLGTTVGGSYTITDTSGSGSLCAMSSSGKYVYTCNSTSNGLLRSTNYGLTFTQIQSTPVITFDCNATGKYVIGMFGTLGSTSVRLSKDYGVTFTQIYPTSGTADINDISISDSGQYILIIPRTANSTTVFVSNNYGQTFTTVTYSVTTNNTSVYCDMSGDGKYMVFIKGLAGVSTGNIYISTNYGVSFTEKVLTKQWYGVGVDSTGQNMIANAWIDGTYVSNDYGVTWTRRIISNDVGRCAVSADGKIMMSLIQNTQSVCLSYNYGINWTSNITISFQPMDCALSYDGEYIFVSCATTSKRFLLRRDYNISGRIGIGTISPLVPLQIDSYVSVSGVNNVNSAYTYNFTNYGYLGANGAGGAQTTLGPINLGVMVRYGIHCGDSIRSWSDSRIKDNIQTIEDNYSLGKLRLIEPKKYTYIDKITRGNSEVLGFIAQEVAQEIPTAVVKTNEFVPNIYNTFDYEDTGDETIKIKSISVDNLNVDDKILLYDTTNSKIVGNILSKGDNEIIVKIDKQIVNDINFNEKIFVYGKQVNDFHNLDKSYLFTINFSATQELDRMIDWHTKEVDRSVSGNATNVYGQSLLTQIKTLESENESLKNRVSTLESQLQNVLSRLQNAGL
jgi:hypothetical protein